MPGKHQSLALTEPVETLIREICGKCIIPDTDLSVFTSCQLSGSTVQ